MAPLIFALFLAAQPGRIGPATTGASLLIDTIESLQQPVRDFRCEFEGSISFKGKVAENFKIVREDGLYETFSGSFIWRQGGDVHSECLRRRAADGQISRESLVVLMKEHRAEQYDRLNDAPLGYSAIKHPREIDYWHEGSLAQIFLVDKLKRDAADETLEISVSNDQTDDRSLKVFNVALRGVPDLLVRRYWIDMRRGGHVARLETFSRGKVVNSRLDIKLAAFKVGDTEVWMPVSGELVGYAAMVDKKPVVMKEPTAVETVYVVGGTLELNKNPGREVFTIKYKPGTPISDSLRKLEYEFGQQKIGAKPTKAEAQNMLEEQIAKAEAQKSRLVVASPSDAFDWTSLVFWGFSVMVVISLAVLLVQRVRR